MNKVAKLGCLFLVVLAAALAACTTPLVVDEVDLNGEIADLTIDDRCLIPWGGKHSFPIALSGNVDQLTLGSSMTVSASAAGKRVVHWQWFLNDRVIPRATKSSITIGSKLPVGSYKLSVIAVSGPSIGFAKCLFKVVAAPPPEPVSTFLEYDGAAWAAPSSEGVPVFVPTDSIDVTFWLSAANTTAAQVISSLVLLKGGVLLEWDGAAWVTPFSRGLPTSAPTATIQILACETDGSILARCSSGEWLQYSGSSWVAAFTNHVPAAIPEGTIQVHESLGNAWYSLDSSGTVALYDLDSSAWAQLPLQANAEAKEVLLQAVADGELMYLRLADGSFNLVNSEGLLEAPSLPNVPAALPVGAARVLTMHYDGHFFALCRN